MLARMFAAFRPKQTTPGLLLCDGEHRDNATRLHEWNRRKYDLVFRIYAQEFNVEESEEAAWWSRTEELLNRTYQRQQAGYAIQARLRSEDNTPTLDAIVYELQVNKKRPNRIRSIK